MSKDEVTVDDLSLDSDIEKLPEQVPAKSQDNEQYASFFEAELDQAAKVMGRHNVLVDDEAKARKYGIEIPSLALQYVTGNDVLFMEHIMLVAGKPASHKSSFAFEVGRWVIQQGGFTRLYDTEGKYSPGLAENLLGGLATNRTWQVRTCESLDAWTELFGRDMKLYRDHFILDRKLKRGEKRPPLLPACMVVDSLTGRTTEANRKTALKEGQASNTQGMRTAKHISDWMQLQHFTYLPWYIIMIRHEKEGGMDNAFMAGRKPKQTPGGKAPDFMGGYDFRFSVVNRDRFESGGYNLVQMKCTKNAFGPDNLRCSVRFSWTWETPENSEDPIQVPRWEWDLATAEFLADYDRAGIKDICHVVRGGSKANPRFNCRQLGLKDVTGDDLGMAVRNDAAVYRALQDYLHIKRWTKFDPSMVVPE